MKVLASDFDGTLYFNGEYKKEDIEAIKNFQQAGNKFGVCTGRPLKGITHFMSKDIKIDFYITNSGACIYDENEEAILKNTMDYNEVLLLKEKFNQQRCVVMCEDKLYVCNDEKGEFSNRGDYSQEWTTQDLSTHVILGNSYHFETDEQASEAVEYINANLKNTEAYQNKNDVDCVAKGCSKETGIKALQKHYGIDENDVACIGDSYNDLPMLMAFKESYSFSYSPKDVQNQAGHIVDQLCFAVEDLMK